ncbi:MAG: hypothetical protein ACRYGP_19895 [Janthinobacterium lividum]
MDFREAIDDLCERVGHEDVAEVLGVSVQAIRQARMNETAKAHRKPPKGWEGAIIKLVSDRIERDKQLISVLLNRCERV